MLQILVGVATFSSTCQLVSVPDANVEFSLNLMGHDHVDSKEGDYFHLTMMEN